MSGIPAGAGSLLGKRLGKYEILALLALGGTAEIYLARISGHAGFEKYVVVKCLHDHLADDQEFVKMFLDEARLASHLDHSNIVQTFELGEHESRYYMVMEFLAGLSLAMVVRRAQERLPGGRMPVPLILNVAAQSCAGLHYAHERTANGKPLNIVHRDISPQNLVISFEGVVKVVDFGIARAEMRETKTKAGTIKGKFAYMSPEQCVATNVDRRTDVFALGVIIWELMTGRRLFKRGSPYETYQAVIECNVPPPSSVNHELDEQIDEIVLKACAKEKENRYATAEGLGDALQGYLHHRGKGSGPAELSRFFDQYFGQEIEEHGERMRELIQAGNVSVDTGMGWGEDDEGKANETVDLSAKAARGKLDKAMQEGQSIELTGGDISIISTGDSSLDQGWGDEGGDEEGGGEDEDDMPAERTRIEANPYEKLKELNELATGAHTPVPPGSITGAEPLPAPPTGPFSATPGGKHVVNAAASGRFPNLANLPTQIAADGSADAPTVGGRPVHVNEQSGGMQAQAPVGAQQNVGSGPNRGPQNQAPMGYPVMSGRPMSTDLAPSNLSGGMGSGAQNALPMGYPVMSGRPSSGDLAPSHLPQAQHSPYAGKPFEAPQQAANMMSPVGQHYPHMDWAAAAAQPAKALPRWMLAALFAGALVGALLITIIIAKIIG